MSETRNEEGRSLADRLLEDARDNHRPVSIYLVSGFQLKGEVMEFDKDTVLFKLKDVCQLVMRSAVATMYPLPGAKGDADGWWRSYISAAAEE